MRRAWWMESVVYQIYPRSFMDSDGDGIGDLPGILSKLDYLRELGVDVIWLCPVYNSPNDDNGYDISDYQSIMREFGTMEDWERLRDGMHERGMKLIMDLVVNHTSDEHPWFESSREARDSRYRDYYFWRPGRDGKPPNNWSSVFGGSAWRYDERTGEYFLHLFSGRQPDLNWDNPEVRREIFAMMTWWLDKGVDGFRMDVINMISKADGLPDAPGGDLEWGGAYFMNGPRVHEYLREMRREALARYDVMTVGETPGAGPDEAARYGAADGSELDMIFQFEHMELDGAGSKWNVKPWRLDELKRTMTRWQKELEGRAWNSLYLNNHDQPRMVSRFGHDGEHRIESAKMLATFLHFQQGTPFIYQGEELGMTNVRFPSIDDYRDIELLQYYREQVEVHHADPGRVMEAIYAKGRDNARTPMQWNDGPNAGFTSGTPWIGVNPNYPAINAAQAVDDPNSIYHYYRRLIQLRKAHAIVVYGSYDLILPEHDQIYAYTRTLDSERLLVVLNFYGGCPVFELPDGLADGERTLLIGNYAVDPNEDIRSVALRPYEARVYRFVRT